MRNCHQGEHPENRNHGPEPFILNIDHAAIMNQNFRTTIWTGRYMQLTLMCIPEKCDIGVEMHPDVDQFIRIESGHAKVCMGNYQSALRKIGNASENDAILIPAGMWHNIVNIGNGPLKLYSLYAPPQHPCDTVHKTKADATHKNEH